VATPPVCVALPVRNGGAYLAEAIESVLAQEGAGFTIHVVDNRSDDDSLDIARRYAASDSRIRVDVNARDVGAYGSLNRILAEASAEYYIPFAADDVMYPGNLARKLDALQSTGAGLAHSTVDTIDETGAIVGRWPEHQTTPGVVAAPGFFERLVPHNCVCCQAVMVRTTALRAIGGFDARSHYAADWLSWMRLALRWTVVTLPEPLLANRVHSESGTSVLSASGVNARDIPVTLDRAFTDPALPANWAASRRPALAASRASMAEQLHAGGVRRVADGWAGYMLMGRAAACLPANPELAERWRSLIAHSGLAVPATPVSAVAIAPADAADLAALAAGVAELGELAAQVIVAVEPGSAERVLAQLQPTFGDTSTDVVLAPTDDPVSLLEPGRIALVRWGSPLVGAAEARSVPVYPYAVPNRFDDPPDQSRWQTVDAAACLI